MACYASGYWLNAADVALECEILMSTNKEEWGIRIRETKGHSNSGFRRGTDSIPKSDIGCFGGISGVDFAVWGFVFVFLILTEMISVFCA